MNYIVQRIKRIERRLPKEPNDGIVWVKKLSEGRYRVERPAFVDDPEAVNRVPEADFGKIVDDRYLERYAVAIVESDAEPMIFRVFHD